MPALAPVDSPLFPWPDDPGGLNVGNDGAWSSPPLVLEGRGPGTVVGPLFRLVVDPDMPETSAPESCLAARLFPDVVDAGASPSRAFSVGITPGERGCVTKSGKSVAAHRIWIMGADTLSETAFEISLVTQP